MVIIILETKYHSELCLLSASLFTDQCPKVCMLPHYRCPITYSNTTLITTSCPFVLHTHTHTQIRYLLMNICLIHILIHQPELFFRLSLLALKITV